MSQSFNHLGLVSWTWQWVHFTQMASTVTRSQSNRAPLGCGGETGDSLHGCAADKSAETAWCYHVNMDKNLWGMFPNLVESMPRRIKAVLKAKGVQPGSSRWSCVIFSNKKGIFSISLYSVNDGIGASNLGRNFSLTMWYLGQIIRKCFSSSICCRSQCLQILYSRSVNVCLCLSISISRSWLLNLYLERIGLSEKHWSLF